MAKQIEIHCVDSSAVGIMAAILWDVKKRRNVESCVRFARELMRETEKQMLAEIQQASSSIMGRS